MKNLNEVLKKLQAIEEAKQKAKQEEKAIHTELLAGVSEEEKTKFISEALKEREKILAERKEVMQNAKKLLLVLREKTKILNEQIALFGYKQANTLRSVQSFSFTNRILKYHRAGVNEIEIDCNKPDWQKTFTAELAKQGIGVTDRVGANIVYRASKLLPTA
jgi:hypothetical protein